MRVWFKVIKCLVAGISMLIGTTAMAAPVDTLSVDQGSYRNTGYHNPSNPNIIVDANYSYRNFFAFDFSGLGTSPVISATLTIFGGSGFYFNLSPTKTYKIFDYSGDITSLLAGTAGVAGYTDLGNGNAYGSTVINTPLPNAPMPEVVITLSALALVDINIALTAADKRFVVGGAVQLSDGSRLWRSSSLVPAAKLSLYSTSVSPVPLPAALPLFGSGLAALGLLGYRRRRVRHIQP